MIKSYGKKYIKRLFAAMLTVVLLLSACACGRVQMEFNEANDIYNHYGEALAYDHGYEWDFGGVGRDYNHGMTDQGNNNFYCLYSNMTNYDGVYYVDDFQECIFNVEDDTWYATCNNRVLRAAFTMSTDSGLCMGADLSKESFCPIIGFMAPQDGVYNLKVNNIEIGNTGLNTADTDGVKLMVYSNRSEVYSEKFSREFERISFGFNVTLKKNEFIYIIIDPLKNGKNDVIENVYLTVSLDTSYTQMYIDHDVTFGFGDVYYLGTKAQQGADGWCYLYGDKNEYGVYNPENFKECKLDANSLTVQTSTFGIWLGDDAQIEQPDGIMTAGKTAAAVLALEVPRKGAYAFDIYFDAEAIGNFSVYCGERRIRIPSFEEGKDGHLSFEAIMQDNERFYFILSEETCEPIIAVRKIEKITGLEETESK